ncbi:hypothetical protein THAOC_29883, partial [Thalassiosira oceanica]
VAARAAAAAAAAAVDHRPIGVPEEQAEVEVQAEVDVDEVRRSNARMMGGWVAATR